MIDRIVVVDSGQVIETTESAIIAKDEADRAEKWAKYSEEQANLASNNAIAAAASKEAAAQSAQSAANTVNGFDAHAADKQQDFDDNAESKTNTYNSNASTLLQQYTDNAAQKLSAYNSNDATKTQAFNDNYTAKLNAFNSNATTKTNDFNSNASEKQAQVDASAETARKWAIGTISEQPNGSAKYWAGQAKTATAGTLNESILTNCLTEIPQDIKLELSNGALTLKAGSKVYVPNGTGVFNTVNITSDRSISDKRFSSGVLVIFSNIYGTSIRAVYTSFCTSGTSAPSDNNYSAWYDTTNNLVKSYSEGSYVDNMSLPIAVCTYVNTEGFTSIDQVFNGFGYIGNTIFALPGIKGLIPNGFNTDGSLNSTEFTTTSVLTYSYFNANSGVLIGVNANSLASDKYVYNKDENYNRNPQGVIAPRAMFAKVSTDSTGRVTSLTPNTAFHAVDYSEYARELDNKVSKTGNETIEGIKTFSQGDIRGKTSTDSKPGVARYATFDKDGVQYSDLWITRSEQGNSNGISYAGLRVSNSSGSVSNRALAIYKKENSDDVVTLAPTPQTSDNSTQIATTAWVNNKFQKVSTLPAQPDPSVIYLIPEE